MIPDQYVNYYMAGVNTLSFFVAINLLFMECYTGLKKEYKDIHESLNIIKKEKVKNGIRIFFLGIFVSDVLLIILLLTLYYTLCAKMAVLNDILGIISLGLAVSTDLLQQIIVGVLMWRFEI